MRRKKELHSKAVKPYQPVKDFLGLYPIDWLQKKKDFLLELEKS
jgi:hypothetical protein